MDFPRHLLPGPLRSRDAGISDLSPHHVCQILPPSTSGSWRNTLYAIPVFPNPMDWPRTAPLVPPLSTAQNQAGLPYFLRGNAGPAAHLPHLLLGKTSILRKGIYIKVD